MIHVRSLIQSCVVLIAAVAFILGGSWSFSADFTVLTTADSGPGSLRQAVIDANTAAGGDAIVFAIPAGECEPSGVCVINLASSLPIVTESLMIDGTTQPRVGSAPANVCATATSPSYLRVHITAPSDYVFTVETFSNIDSFEFRGLALSSESSTTDGIRYHTLSEGTIQCNHFGTDGTGTVALDMGSGLCVSCFGGGGNLIIGTNGDGVDDVAERNVFAAGSRGVNVNGGDSAYPNWIAGNYFGVGADGTTAMDLATGVYLRQSTAQSRIGSNFDGISDDLEKNVFAHCTDGVWLNTHAGSSYVNFVTGNWIGRDARGRIVPNYRGIRFAGETTDVVISRNQIVTNSIGLYVAANATLNSFSGDNCIMENSTGVSHEGTAVGLWLEDNYWGAADGPSGTGSGTGDEILVSGSGSVDFTPWLTSPNEVCVFIFVDGFDGGNADQWDGVVGGP